MELIGHRGLMGEHPQNTLVSFEAAIKAGLPMIELDTELAKTGEVVIFHDDEVDNVTRGQASGSINELSFDEIRRLNVHGGYQDGRFYQVPTLEEVLNLVNKMASETGRRAKINIELKGAGTAEPVARIVNQYLAQGFTPKDFIVSSFRHDELAKFKQIIPAIDIAVLIDDKQWEGMERSSEKAVGLTKELGGVAINPGIGFVNEELVKRAHEAGLGVNVWTVKTAEDYEKMLEMSVDGVFTNIAKDLPR